MRLVELQEITDNEIGGTMTDYECKKCGHVYAVRENSEPTPFCDECAHDEVARLSALVKRLRKRLRDRDET